MATATETTTFAKYTDGGGSWITSGTQKLRAGISSSGTEYDIALEFDFSSYSTYTINSITVYLYHVDYTNDVRWEYENAITINSNGTVTGSSGSGYRIMNHEGWKGFEINNLSWMVAYGILHIYGASSSTYGSAYDATSSYAPYAIIDYTIPTPETNDAYVVAGTISGTEITFGTPLNHSSNVWGQYIAPIGDDFALIYPRNDITSEYVKSFSISGTTITQEDNELWLSVNSQNANIITISDTKFIIFYDMYNSTTFTYDTYGVCCTVDTSLNITVGTALKIADDSFSVIGDLLDTDRAVFIYNDDSYKLVTIDISGTTLEVDKTIDLFDSESEVSLSVIDTNLVSVIFKDTYNKGFGASEIINLTLDITDEDYYARYAEVTTSGTGSATMFIRGNKINDSTTSVIIDNSKDGKEYKNNNELIDDSTHANSVGTHINDILSNRKRVTLKARTDPSIDIGDTFKHDTTYNTDDIFLSYLKLEFDGGFIGTHECVVID